MTRQLHLNAFIHPAGHHEAAWRHRATEPERIYDADYYRQIARTAEAAKFDAIFFADGPALRQSAEFNASGRLEPIVLLTAIAAATEKIGLIATASTTYHEPYNLARLFSSLDFVSGGRAGWNIVTTSTALAAGNFGLPEHPDPAVRYERAREFVDAAIKLWDSWEDDAVEIDREGGRTPIPTKFIPSSFAASIFRYSARSMRRAHPKDILFLFKLGHRTMAATSPDSMPRQSSRRIKQSRTRKRSTPILRTGRALPGATPTM